MAKKKNEYLVAVDGSQGFVAPRRKHKKHNMWKYVITFFTGQLTLLVFLVVGIVIGASSVTTGTIIDLLGQDSTKFLTEDYRNISLFETAMKFTSGVEINCINDLKAIIPEATIDEYVTKVTDKAAEFGITFSEEEIKGNNLEGDSYVRGLYGTPFSEIGDWVSSKLDTIEIATVLSSETVGMGDLVSNKILQKLLYNTKEVDNPDFDPEQEESDDNKRKIEEIDLDNPKTLAELKDGGIDFNSLINSLSLKDVLGDDAFADGGSFAFLAEVADDPVMELGDSIKDVQLYKFLGTDENAEGIMGKIGKKTINELSGGTDALLEGVKLSDVLTIDENSPSILQALKNCYVSSVPEDDPTGKTLSQKIDELQLSSVLTIDDSSSKILQALKDCYITSKPDGVAGAYTLAEKIDVLQLKDVLNIDENSSKILQAIKDCYISSVPDGVTGDTISTKLDTITIGEIMDVSDNKLLSNLGGSTLSSLGTDVGNLKFCDVFADEIYETGTTTLKGTWKYMFCDKDTGTYRDVDHGDEKAYTLLNDLSKMVDNLTSKMANTTLYDLFDDGLISGFSRSQLNTQLLIGYSSTGPVYGGAIGDYTIGGLINALTGGSN